jgi:peptide/nickel transport system substrate-binding protein
MKKVSFIAMAMLVALTFALAGCSSSKGGGTNKASGQKSVLVYGRGADTSSLDPATQTDGETFKVTKNIYDTIVDYKGQTTQVTTGLASGWKISGDGKTYTFTLRKGVKFQDGSDFNADAVVYNFDRWKSGDAGKFAYYASMFGGVGDKSVIDKVVAVDPITVQFVLKHPFAPFLKDLAMSPFAIASPKALKKYGDKYGENVAVGTGPFIFKEWKHKDTITLVKNDNYWKKGYPKLDEVIFKVIPDNTARLNALKDGEIDLMDGVNPSDLSSVQGNNKLQIFHRPPMNVGYLGFNTQMGPFKNTLVRQALSYTVDKDALLKAFYNGDGTTAVNPMPPSIPGYDTSVQPFGVDIQKAKDLLKQAGYPNGFTTDFWAMPNPRPYMPDPQKIAEALAADFQKAGVKVNIKSMEWTTYLDKVQKGEAPMFLLGWTGDNGDADNFLYTLLSTDAIGSNNYARYSNPKVDALLKQAQVETDEAKRIELYKQAQEIIHEDAPWIPLVYSKEALVGSSKIKGFKPHPTGSDKLEQVSMGN